MIVTTGRCASCGALVDVEDLFCANCGAEVPDHRPARSARLAIEAENFQCRGCGASMNYDAGAQALKCPFCGSLDLAEEAGGGILRPDCVIPFAIDRAEAEGRLRAWLGSSFWHPADLRPAAQLTELRAVFLPFWVFSTRVETHWTADTSRTPPGARADWFPIAGRAERDYDDVWVPAGSGISPGEIDAVGPFDARAAVSPSRVDLVDVTVEQFTVPRRYARPLAQGHLESAEAQAVARDVPGSNRNVRVNVLMEDATSRAALAPFFIMAYHYRGRVYRFVVNGQTGSSTGTAPVATSKVAGLVGLLLILAIVILLLVANA